MKKLKRKLKPFKGLIIVLAALTVIAGLLFFLPWALNARDTVTNAAGVLVAITVVYAGVYTLASKL